MELTEESINTVRPHFQSCVERLTADQWRLVASGTPDINTKHRLAHMLVKVLSGLSGIWSKPGVRREQVQDSVNSSVTLSIKETLGVESVHSPSTDNLTEFIATEIEDCVKTPRTQMRVTPPQRLNAMIGSLCNILGSLAGKMKKRHCKVGQGLYRRQTSRKKAQSLQDIISDEVNQIISPILDDVSHAEYRMLDEEFSADTQSTADDITQSLTEALYAKENQSFTSQGQMQELDSVRTKICDFFAKMFIRASMCQIISQVKAKFTSEGKAAHNESLRSLMCGVESVLWTSDGTKTTLSTQTWELSTLLYGYITAQTPQTTTEDAAVIVPQRHINLYIDIRSRVICFLSLLSWWLSNQLLLNSVLLALTDTKKIATLQLSEISEISAKKAALLKTCTESVQDTTEPSACKNRLTAVIMKLFNNMHMEVKDGYFSVSDLENKVYPLVDEVWDELRETNNVDIKTKDVDGLYKAILKGLRKNHCTAVSHIESGNLPGLQKTIVTSCMAHLRKKEKVSSVYSTVRHGISNIFRFRKPCA